MRQTRGPASLSEPRTLCLSAPLQVAVTRWNPDGEARGVSTAADYVEFRRADNVRRKAVFLRALESSMGIVSSALKLAEMNRTTYRDWCMADTAFKRRVEEITECALDFSEAQLFRRIKEGDLTAITFYLRTKGRKRGYGMARHTRRKP